jgi:plasmid maintenance system killer protein
VIKTCKDRDTAAVFRREPVRRFGPEVSRAALRKLLMLDAASRLESLRVPPGNRLEALKGTRKGSTVSASTINGGSASGGRMAEPTMSRSWIITDLPTESSRC